MKKLFFILVAMMFATMSFAQQQVAMLAHGDSLKYFYGSGAFAEAMDTAVEGDVINLSGGVFYSKSINKAVSICGAGFDTDIPTIISDDFDFVTPENATVQPYIEGIHFYNKIFFGGKVTDACFVKCKIATLVCADYNELHNVSFINCQIGFADLFGDGYATANFVNCYIDEANMPNDNSHGSFINCVVTPHLGWETNTIESSTLINCIIIVDNNYRSLPSNTIAKNCIGIGSENVFSDVLIGENNVAGLDMSVFIDSDKYNDLTDEAIKYHANGTHVGVFGGYYPYNTKLSYPIISKFKVSEKATEDNKISVEVGVAQ